MRFTLLHSKLPNRLLPHLLWGALLCASLSGCTPASPQDLIGYVEGEYVYLSVPVSGYLKELPLRRGAHVAPGQMVFGIAADLDEKNLAQAQQLAQAAGQRSANMITSRRTPEITGAQANLQAARSVLDVANSRLRREEQLAAQNFVSELVVDEARNQQKLAQAQWESAQAALQLAHEPIGRVAERSAAKAEYQAAQSLAAQKQWLVDHSSAKSEATGELVDFYFRVGEWVPAGKPVASVLPDTGRLIRFFVPATVLTKLRVGQQVQISCDACPVNLVAPIEVIYPRAEYSPPVIYSKEQRHKLLFRVDARPGPGAYQLPPGLPVTVRLPP
ncbi:MAG: hypothetical protein RLZZ371_1714 [Pseudomonadota bacterium]